MGTVFPLLCEKNKIIGKYQTRQPSQAPTAVFLFADSISDKYPVFAALSHVKSPHRKIVTCLEETVFEAIICYAAHITANYQQSTW